MRGLVAGLVFLLGGALGASGQEEVLYVCNQDDATIGVIDIGALEVVRTIDLKALGFGPNAKPHHVVVEPDGGVFYVSLIGENRVVKLDRAGRLLGQVAFETPGMLALHPSEDVLFVGRSMTAVNPPQRIGAIPRSTFTSVEEIDIFFPRPHALAVGPKSGVVYTASLAVNQLASVDAGSEKVELLSLAGPQHAVMQFAISADGRTLVASGELSRQFMIFDIGDPMKPRLVQSIEVGAQPFDPILSRDGLWAYVGNKAANTITVIDMQARSVDRVLEGHGMAQPHGSVVSPDGRYVFISNNNLKDAHAMHGAAAPTQAARDTGGNGSVVVIDAATRQIVKVIEVGRNATGIGVRQIW